MTEDQYNEMLTRCQNYLNNALRPLEGMLTTEASPMARGIASRVKDELYVHGIVPVEFRIDMNQRIIDGVLHFAVDIVPPPGFVMAKGDCPECQGQGGNTHGHYDQGWSDCRYCEATGTQKWARCRECNKFGEVPDHSKEPWGGVKKCSVCKGEKTLPLDYYTKPKVKPDDKPHPLDID